ncbi:DUF4352 domain-containing protein [Thomasclavelia spiroformis]|uniref:DUF4352 domain-containing protein n=1 Tax=Thomasclavelia spiroformis TaxID=29348 RepID=UPI0029427BB2|nr:DUF4352 domain-containing protein [Thomasclavelia spiroformis]
MKKKIKWIVLAIIVLGVIGAAMGGNDNESEQKKDTKTEQTTEKKEEKKEKEIYDIGETAEVDGIKITVNSTRIDEGIISAENGKQYFVLDITLENTTDEEFSSSSMMCYELKDADGRKIDMSIGANLNGSLDTSVAPGEKAVGEIAFETSPEGELTLRFTPNLTDSVRIKVR